MARRLNLMMGPSLPDAEAYGPAFPSGFTLDTALAPTGSVFRIKHTGSGSSYSQYSATDDLLQSYLTGARWSLVTIRIVGTLVITADIELWEWQGIKIRQRRVSGSTYKVVLLEASGSVELGVTDSTFNTGTDYVFRIQTDGTTAVLDVDGTNEVVAASTKNIDKVKRVLADTLDSGVDRYYNAIMDISSDSADPYADRGDTVNIYRLTPDANDQSAHYFNVSGSCDDGSAAYTDWDDWASGAHSTGTQVRECGADGNVEISRLSNPGAVAAIANGVLKTVSMSASNDAAKTVNFEHEITDGTSSIDQAIQALTSTAFERRIGVFLTAADGGTWTQVDLDGLRAGVVGDAANGANDYHAAFGCEFGSFANDAGSAPAGGPGAGTGTELASISVL